MVETYDKLVLATGSVPISPKVPGRDLANIHFLKRFQDGQSVDKELAAEEVKMLLSSGPAILEWKLQKLQNVVVKRSFI